MCRHNISQLTYFKKLKQPYTYLTVGSVVLLLIIGSTWLVWQDASMRYSQLLSRTTYDRTGTPISLSENSKGHYVYAVTALPSNFEALLLKKEDRFFRYHLGINPISTMRAALSYLRDGHAGGSSTITQQLAKNLLNTETQRTFVNKLIESAYAFSIECFASKDTIVTMYANTAYFGNQLQGIGTASYAYFGKPLSETSHSEQISLLATLSYPSTRNPWEADNAIFSHSLNQRISPTEPFMPPDTTTTYALQHDVSFELRTAHIICDETCTTTIDDNLTTTIRAILDRHIQEGWQRNIRNGAVVVINPHTEELLAMVGSRDPASSDNGNQINMALEPRPIGSTVKPFIYAEGFARGLRPYSLVEDREYKYPIATGFSLYPKNYDGTYHGEVTLHEALSNSLNVPSVKTLEFIGLDAFYTFLSDDLHFEPIQDYNSYQYGIALGGLEMDLLTLTHYFSLFPRGGSLAPLRVLTDSTNNFNLPPQSHIEQATEVLPNSFTQLVHAIISDRYTGVNQFGLEGNLNLTYDTYGVKTGTSRDFHDSWVVGYTGDFVVGVWIGNTENEALDQVSGSSGAGAIWHDVMEYLLSTPYHTQTPITTDQLQRFFIDGNDEWGLQGDIITDHRTLLQEHNLILSIHEGDVFEQTTNLTIPLRARTDVTWTIDGTVYQTAQETSFTPREACQYEIIATDNTGMREIVTIKITQPE